jgi:hypothetical protein
MQGYHAIRDLKKDSTLKEGDVLVLFGELFTRGYANGLVEEAERRGLKIIRTTVGRREKDGTLRALTAEEATAVPKPFINIPLEAGFDLEPDEQGVTPVDQIRDVKLSDWETAPMNKASLEVSRKKGRERFLKNLRTYLQALEEHLPAGKNVVFAHLMAGGVPRTKIVMPLMNRALRGSGDKFLSSEKFWNSAIGQFCEQNFYEVTAETFAFLIQESAGLREKIQKSGGRVAYTAYGYHGTEVLVGDQYLWQTYSPYVQGWAKLRLETYAREFRQKGIACAVYNCPEILTNSSAIFNGVEVSLYPLLGALKKEGPSSAPAKSAIEECLHMLKPGHTLESVMAETEEYLMSPVIREHCQFDKWPQHNSKPQLEKMLAASEHLQQIHRDPKQLMTFVLSELVLEACGKVMLADCMTPEAPVSWINHDVIARITAQS